MYAIRSYYESIELAREERIGSEGVAAADLGRTLARATAALDALRARHADGSLPLLRLPANHHDLGVIIDIARRLTVGSSDVVFLGTGGSSLGGQTLCALADRGFGPRPGAPRLRFRNNFV